LIDKYRPDIFFICEAEVTVDISDYINVEGYDLELSGSINLGKARLIAYIRPGVGTRKRSLEGNDENLIIFENSHERIMGVYRGFKNYREPGFDALGYLFTLLNDACKTQKTLTVLGDFNIDPVRDGSTPQGLLLEDLMINNNLFQLMKHPTRSRSVHRDCRLVNEESTIDLILRSSRDTATILTESTTSDHKLIGVVLTQSVVKHATKKISIRDWTNLTPNNVARLASGAPDPKSLDELSSSFSYLLEKLAPFRVVRTRLPTNLINPKVEKIKKKRDRLYRMYKISQDEHFLAKVNKENKKLKKMILSETKRVFQKKAEGINSKSFWSTVGQMQGKVKKIEKGLIIDGKLTEDDQIKANGFATFFEQKILKLTSSMLPISLPQLPLEKMTNLSYSELTSALEHYKTKMSAGPDGIPMRLVKFYTQKRPNVILEVFNEIIAKGFPDDWRLARVTPIPKKGDMSNLSSYRPVSNLSSISKLFERCILHRLMALPNFLDLVGSNQHGFLPYHSTTTCLLELKDTICDALDEKKQVLAYSLDLSAAFDMLRPDTFNSLLKDKIPIELLGMLQEFLSNRKFYVEINGKASSVIEIDRGCPQGSVLGPILFNMYTSCIKEKLPSDAFLTSYADDSYVVLKDDNVEDLVMKTEACLSSHINHLEEIGMKVNESKTEIVLFGASQPGVLINVRGEAVGSKDCIKALGITIDKGLSWKPHVANIRSRVMKVIGGVRMIRNKLSIKQTTSIVTAQVLSLLYYACSVWLTPSINKKSMRTIESLHF